MAHIYLLKVGDSTLSGHTTLDEAKEEARWLVTAATRKGEPLRVKICYAKTGEVLGGACTRMQADS
jgi:hypothetical protein